MALHGQPAAIGGHAVAELSGLPYKVVVDALGRMLDAGVVVRHGRKYSASWALAATPAAVAIGEGIGALEAVWRSARPPHPRGGGRFGPPA